MIKSIMTMAFLVLIAIFDLKDKRIPLGVIVIGGIISFFRLVCVLHFAGPFSEQVRIISVALAGALPGLAMTILSFCSDKTGKGDGPVIMMIGINESCTFAALLMCFACILMALFSIVPLALRKITKNTKMPYIPFVAGAFAIMKLSENVGF